MALLCNVRNTGYNYCAYFLINLIKRRTKSVSVEVDALDAFTSQLIQEKSYKWDNMKLKNKIMTTSAAPKIKKVCEVQDDIAIRTISDTLLEGIEENNPEKIMAILETCRKREMVPFNLMIKVLSYFAQIGHVEGIKYMQTIYEERNPGVLQLPAHFQQYLAEAVWVKGNIPKALSIFKDVYRNNNFLRRDVRLVLRYLFYNAAQKNSEAIMVAISKFTEDLVIEFKDYVPMVNLWKICFLSEWYSDQVLAINLLDRYRELLKPLLPQVPIMVAMSLKCHKTEPVYKLLEILLKYDCKVECSMVLIALFDYKIRQRDLYSCSQILQWSTKYNVLLPALQQEKLLQLLLNVKTNYVTKPVVQKERKDYNLKF